MEGWTRVPPATGDVHDQSAMLLGIIPARSAGCFAEEFQGVLLIALLVLEEPDVDVLLP
jgi:hypothetical protein